jgi:hypothetical protein
VGNPDPFGFSQGDLSNFLATRAPASRVKVVESFNENLPVLCRWRIGVFIPPPERAQGLPAHDSDSGGLTRAGKWLVALTSHEG